MAQQPVFTSQPRYGSAQQPQLPQMAMANTQPSQFPQVFPARGQGPSPGQSPHGSIGRPNGPMPARCNGASPCGATPTMPKPVVKQAQPPLRAQMPQPLRAPAQTLMPTVRSSQGGKRKTIYHPEPDGQLDTLKDIRRQSGLKDVPVSQALAAMRNRAVDGMLTRDQFNQAYEGLLAAHVSLPVAPKVRAAVYNLFDRDDNGVIDMMELICGVSILCSGTEDEKILAVFNVFDENGDGFVSMDEMFKFLSSIFKVVLTPQVLDTMNSMGVLVEAPDDLASVTVQECFKKVDLNHDGKLSIVEFKEWFCGHGDDHSMLNPLTEMLS